MTPERFRYLMCPIRHFKETVQQVESYQNFIFAVDTSGNVGVFLISEADLENDDETMQVEGLSFPGGVAYIKHFVSHSQQKLLIITNTAAIYYYGIEQTAPASFTFTHLSTEQLPLKNPSYIYV
jgi:hypothetical protein